MAFLKISENSQLTMTIGSDVIVFDSLVSIEVPESSVKNEGKKTIIGKRVGKYKTGQRELEQATIKLSNIQTGHYMILKDVFRNNEDFTLIYTEEDSYNSINFISPFLYTEPRPSMVSEDEGTMDIDLVVKCSLIDIEFKD